MTVLIGASPRNTNIVKELIEGLAGIGARGLGVKLGQYWQTAPRAKLEAASGKASHSLLVADSDDASSSWLAYLVGLSRGRERPIGLFRIDPAWQPQAWLAGIPVFDDIQEALGYYAAEKGEWEIAEARRLARACLLELGISWHAESFAQCVREGDFKAVDLFIASGYPPDVRDRNGVPMVCLAARHKHQGIVEMLLDRGGAIDVQSDDRGFSPLMDAAQNGDRSLVTYLMQRGAEPNLVSKDGQSALVIVVGRNDVETAKLLLENGADPDQADKLGLSARKYAKLFHNAEMEALFS